MYRATIKGVLALDGRLTMESENRAHMRALESLCIENELTCEIVVDVAPRVVKFKGISPTPTAQAKADAKADIEASKEVS